MPPMTDEQAQAAREELAAYEAAKAAAARQAENERRTAARALVEPLAAIVQGEALTAATDALRGQVQALGGSEWDLANLTRNAVQVLESLAARTARRQADLEPVPEPPAPPAE